MNSYLHRAVSHGAVIVDSPFSPPFNPQTRVPTLLLWLAQDLGFFFELI